MDMYLKSDVFPRPWVAVRFQIPQLNFRGLSAIHGKPASAANAPLTWDGFSHLNQIISGALFLKNWYFPRIFLEIF